MSMSGPMPSGMSGNMPGGMSGAPTDSMPMNMDTPSHDGHDGTFSYTCDGEKWMDMGDQRLGSWNGHFLPGLILLIWSFHWMIGCFKNYLLANKQHGYRAQATYSLPFLPAKLPMEGILKVTICFFAIWSELWWSHGHWRSSLCPADTKRAGHFYVTHLYSWENAWVLAAFMFSGIIDIAAAFHDLPDHCEHFFLALAFGVESFLLAQGEHTDMLEDMMYYLLYMAAAGSALFVVGEVAYPDSFWMSAGRVFSTLVQAVWFFAAARIMYEDLPMWSTTDPVPDMGPAMLLPVVFVLWLNICAIGMLAVYLAMRWLLSRTAPELLKAGCSVERTLMVDGSEAGGEGGKSGGLMAGGSHPGHGPAKHSVGPKAGAKDTELHEMTPLISKLV